MMCSNVSIALVTAVGIAVLVRRGWRVALLHTVPLALRSFVDASGTSAWGQLFAMSVLAILPIFLVFLVFQRLIIEGVAMSGMKR